MLRIMNLSLTPLLGQVYFREMGFTLKEVGIILLVWGAVAIFFTGTYLWLTPTPKELMEARFKRQGCTEYKVWKGEDLFKCPGNKYCYAEDVIHPKGDVRAVCLKVK